MIEFAPGVVELKDEGTQTYLVDEKLSYLLLNRRVWTDPTTKHLMVEDMSYRQKNTVMRVELAVWLYRIASLTELSVTEIELEYKDKNPRNVTYDNLRKVQKGVTRHDSTTSTILAPPDAS